jgi:hypothetical protein
MQHCKCPKKKKKQYRRNENHQGKFDKSSKHNASSAHRYTDMNDDSGANVFAVGLTPVF